MSLVMPGPSVVARASCRRRAAAAALSAQSGASARECSFRGGTGIERVRHNVFVTLNGECARERFGE